ncbi:DUF6962 family protein [Microbulbifer sp. VAAC004]|uniref:DUF6962 family protein n=1 Tax=unclassified Microbulbifer TaxID=2619833 RepID=UPI00403A399A
MLKLTDVPTEQVSAITDLVLAVLALFIFLYFIRPEFKSSWKRNCWICFFGVMFVVGLLGSVIHGFQIAGPERIFMWHVLFFFLGLFLVSFTLAIIGDLAGERISRKLLPYIFLIGLIFYFIAVSRIDGFIVFVGYQALVMIPVVIGYTWMGVMGRLPGAWYMVIGGFVSLLAVVLQVRTALEFTFIWTFNHNSLYHMVQTIGVLFFFAGIRKSLQASI